MISSADLQREVLERMEALGRGKHLTVSVISRHGGDDRSTSAVWAALEQLYVDQVVERWGEDTYELPVERGPAAATHDQTSFEDGGPQWPG